MISVIIPAFNEEKALPGTLSALLTQPGEYEVIVVDGGSNDHTREIVTELMLGPQPSARFVRLADSSTRADSARLTVSPRGERALCTGRLLTAPKGRASQMNAGARQASGEWLLFLHADTVLPDGALLQLNKLEKDHAVQAGGFMHQFSSDDWRLKLISFLDNFRCTCSRIIYGDQALFVRRALFERLGGFPNQPILEDVAFCEKLLTVTTPLLLTSPVVTDARKFLKMGVWRSFVRVLLIILHVEYRLPVLPRVFFQDIR